MTGYAGTAGLVIDGDQAETLLGEIDSEVYCSTDTSLRALLADHGFALHVEIARRIADAGEGATVNLSGLEIVEVMQLLRGLVRRLDETITAVTFDLLSGPMGGEDAPKWPKRAREYGDALTSDHRKRLALTDLLVELSIRRASEVTFGAEPHDLWAARERFLGEPLDKDADFARHLHDALMHEWPEHTRATWGGMSEDEKTRIIRAVRTARARTGAGA